MLRRDFARTTDSIGATDFYKMAMDFHDRQKQKELDANEIMSGYQKGVNMQRQNALADALQSGDEEAINKAAAAYDPQTAMQERLSRMAEQRKFDQQKELLGIKNQYDVDAAEKQAALAREIAQIKAGGYGTAAMQNMAHLQELGFSPKESALLVHAGQNNAIGQIYPSLGKEGAKKTDQEIGKNYAADLDEYNNMVSKMPELESTVKELGDLSDEATYMAIGRLYNDAKRELKGEATQGGVALTKYKTIVDNQILPLLRDTFGAQFTQKEGETLKATLGDPNKTPEERKATLKSFIDQKRKSIESKYRKLQSYEQGMGAKAPTPTDEEAFGDI